MLEKRIVIDKVTARAFDYESEPDQATWSGLLEVHDVQLASDHTVLLTQLCEFDLVMTWSYLSTKAMLPRLFLDGTYIYWSSC